MSQFLGAQISEIRVYENPADPEHSKVIVILPNTVIDAVFNASTGESLVQILAALTGSINGHTANTDMHTTAEWKTNVAQGVGTISTHVTDTSVHVTAEKQTAWNGAVEKSAEALDLAESQSGTISTLQSQVQQLAESVYNGITANPYAISFDDLDGISVPHGIYNATKQRIEC